MARKTREWYPGAIYHIMHRGIRRKEIFSHEEDYTVYMTFLKAEIDRYDCLLHAYCLMTNHVHLLIETTCNEIWKPMKSLSHNYAQYYNGRNAYRGHLFEGRYVSCTVKDDVYFLQTSRYIHLNPVKAHMVMLAEEYRWSSYRTMIGYGADRLTETSRTLSYFREPAQLRYRRFVEDRGHKFYVSDDHIHMAIEKDEIWLPW